MPEKTTALSFEEFSILLNAFDPFEDHPRVAVAVSGGSDSLALTLLLQEWVRKRQGQLVALTVDHQLRPESAQEAKIVQDWLKAYGIPHVILPWKHAQVMTGLQEAARLARYRLLEEWCQNNGFLHLFLGHHAGDQFETIVQRTLNHSGLMGLAGMSQVLEKGFGRLVRPLLTTPKARLKQYLLEKGQEWIEDPSNVNPRFQRSTLRTLMQHNDFDLLPSLSDVQTYRESVERWLNRFLAQYACLYPFGYVELKMEPFLRLPVDFQKPVLLQILKTIGVGSYPPKTQTLEPIVERLQSPHFKAATCHGVRISGRQECFVFAREHRRVQEKWRLDDSPSVPTLSFDRRFDVNLSALKQDAGEDICLQKIGEKGWAQLVSHYPSLKAISLYKPALWSLPSAWRGSEILLKCNMVYEWLIMPQEKRKQKYFIFKPGYNFSCFIFSKSS